ncbi:MAG: zinc ABC transporter substrate-binding protein [Alphaproteobacteria bacterium]|nr:zinc ABC transporter substrate-binding protein [Alphaproteobacteria bacterium]MBU0797872.1 zinc ABC transporter substrate-binding protein [Alphaproteobacteria bacterium]MBU0886176.1 zinc ABC transporter substrate-binding protein [Alphaproteobacteria bacterium]MBU1812816.1 zinc ABC transporter substrate-binding protein [Alphaproteobacteria bacterium]
MLLTRSIHRLLPLVAGAVFSALGAAQAAEAPKVVVSVKPLHGLVAGVMQGVGTPSLLVKGAGSEHTYTLKPSDARTLSQADLVFWVGESLETFLTRPLQSLGGKARVIELIDAEGVETLKLREGGAWEAHADDDDHGHKGHDHGKKPAHDHGHKHEAKAKAHDHDDHAGLDGHIWLDPHNAEAIVKAAAAALSQADPSNAAVYARNAETMIGRIEAMDAEIAALLEPLRATPYIVFHDAYQYFEAHYGTNAVGSITLSPERQPSAQRLSEIRQRLAETKARCVFAEPQFTPALVDVVIEGTPAQKGVLDPIGAGVAEGPDAYFGTMRALAQGLRRCLALQS